MENVTFLEAESLMRASADSSTRNSFNVIHDQNGQDINSVREMHALLQQQHNMHSTADSISPLIPRPDSFRLDFPSMESPQMSSENVSFDMLSRDSGGPSDTADVFDKLSDSAVAHTARVMLSGSLPVFEHANWLARKSFGRGVPDDEGRLTIESLMQSSLAYNQNVRNPALHHIYDPASSVSSAASRGVDPRILRDLLPADVTKPLDLTAWVYAPDGRHEYNPPGPLTSKADDTRFISRGNNRLQRDVELVKRQGA